MDYPSCRFMAGAQWLIGPPTSTQRYFRHERNGIRLLIDEMYDRDKGRTCYRGYVLVPVDRSAPLARYRAVGERIGDTPEEVAAHLVAIAALEGDG